MAQYWEDWSGSTIGLAPTGWTERWNVDTFSSLVESDAAGPAGRRLRISKSATGRALLSLDALDAVSTRADFKMRALIKGPDTTTLYTVFSGLAGRASGAVGSETMYVSAFAQAATASSTRMIILHEYLNGTTTQLDTTGQPGYEVGELYWVGLECSGTSIRKTLATAADPNTLIHDVTVTDASISAAGWIGLMSHATVSAPYDIYAVGVGTDGDAAPTSDPSVVVVKGAVVTLHNGATPQASLTGITARWWDSPTATGAPLLETSTASTDASGVLTLNIDAATALSVGGVGYLSLYKAGAGAESDLHFASRITVSDIG